MVVLRIVNHKLVTFVSKRLLSGFRPVLTSRLYNTMAEQKVKGLRERLATGEHIVVAEGYMAEFEKRGYLRNDTFTPEVVLQHPEVVQTVHEEFVRAGSDVVVAFTYYGYRSQLNKVGLVDETEKLNRLALRIAKDVAVRHGVLMAGNLSNTLMYNPDDPESHAKIRVMYKEQVEWAVQEGADYIIGETHMEAGEAYLALEAIQKYGNGLAAVITMCPFAGLKLQDGVSVIEAARTLEERGAAVVGFNCARGPDSMLPALKELRAACKGPIACIPNPYRTSADDDPCLYFVKDPRTGKQAFPDQMDAWLCSRGHIEDFTRDVKDTVQYIGLCCGNRPHYTRSMCMALGRKPVAAEFVADYSKRTKIRENEFFYAKWTEQSKAAGLEVDN